ncbi:hypothetical protein HDU76_001273 [Blyttiomyces sp. JEL0837]|nr:hypothetical protein HDU76_001273 [Blyttiomyces sp. JEL0837]
MCACFDMAGIMGAVKNNLKLVKTFAIYNWVKLLLIVFGVILAGVSGGFTIVLAVAVAFVLISIYLTIVYWSFYMDLRDSSENHTMIVTTPNV